MRTYIKPNARPLVRAAAIALALSAAVPALAFDAKQSDQSVLRIVNFEILKSGQTADSAGIGTGFVVDNEYVVTNHHVINDEEYVGRGSTAKRMVVDGTLEKLRVAELIWSSRELDLAVLKVPGLTRPAVALTGLAPSAYPNKGEIVWAIGYPGIADTSIKSTLPVAVESTLTQGVVAGVRDGKNPTYGDKIRPVIQHSSSINKGNSGGPLFDNCGTVIGVNTFAPVSEMYVGGARAQGMPNSGIFYAPHIANFIEAQKTVPQLRAINLRIVNAPCATATGDTGEFPVWAYAAIGVFGALAIAAAVLALRKGTTREVVRMVESYSAYVKRKGRAPSDFSLQPRKMDMSPSAAAKLDATSTGRSQAAAPPANAGPSWKLSGKGGQGQTISQTISADRIAQATTGKEQGLIIGRSATLADVSIDDSSVSRRHAKLYATETGLALEDLKSAFGTLVNGHKLEPFQAVEIKAGDKISLGAVELTLEQRG